jgi:HlyD family secretion protein
MIPASLGEDTVEHLYAEHGPARPWIYWLLLLGVFFSLASLPLLMVDVSVRAAGMVRPTTQRADLRPAVSGHIAEVLAHDNARVHSGQPLLVLRSTELAERLAHNSRLQTERATLIADLQQLTNGLTIDATAKNALLTPVLQQEHTQLLAQLDSYRLAETKAGTELARYATLAAKGIATQQELDHARYESERLQAESRLVLEQTRARWQTRLREENIALTGLLSEAQRLREELANYTVRAPADGVLVDINGWSIGGFVAAGQSLGAVSPEDTLQVEVHVTPRDIGLVRVGQTARLQIDAYPYTQWGTLDGIVTAISGDLVGAAGPGGSAALFKVLVRPAATHLALPNGARGELKKGLTLSARFLVARRSLFQLLYDDVSAWLDPDRHT